MEIRFLKIPDHKVILEEALIALDKDWFIFSENIGKRLSIDETYLSNGELYTILTNKAKKERKEL
jgi:hypothetical protein